MKHCLLIPKDAPHLCLHAEGDMNFSHMMFREILPPNHPCRDKQVWMVEDSLIRLAKNPKMVLYGSNDSSVYLVDLDIMNPYKTMLLKKRNDKIHRYYHNTGLGLCAPQGGMEAGKRAITGTSEEMCGFEFRDIEENKNDDDVANEPNAPQDSGVPRGVGMVELASRKPRPHSDEPRTTEGTTGVELAEPAATPNPQVTTSTTPSPASAVLAYLSSFDKYAGLAGGGHVKAATEEYLATDDNSTLAASPPQTASSTVSGATFRTHGIDDEIRGVQAERKARSFVTDKSVKCEDNATESHRDSSDRDGVVEE